MIFSFFRDYLFIYSFIVLTFFKVLGASVPQMALMKSVKLSQNGVTRATHQQHCAPEVTSNIRLTFVSFDDQHGAVLDSFARKPHRLDKSVIVHAAR